jgi:hypothetical protein
MAETIFHWLKNHAIAILAAKLLWVSMAQGGRSAQYGDRLVY